MNMEFKLEIAYVLENLTLWVAIYEIFVYMLMKWKVVENFIGKYLDDQFYFVLQPRCD